ncbi:MAG: hypothetical protein ABL877_13455 [Thiobacillus sp.]
MRYSPKNKMVRNDCAWGSYRRKNPRLKGNCKLGMKNASILRFGKFSKLAVLVRRITLRLYLPYPAHPPKGIKGRPWAPLCRDKIKPTSRQPPRTAKCEGSGIYTRDTRGG